MLRCRCTLKKQIKLGSQMEKEGSAASTLTNKASRASLVVQWLRIRLTMRGTRVRALVREDSTCRGATKPMCHNY
ncbi:hypothetical protein J1605_005502 [Eschrichtius robustus]|uniref:Uncharacterized protein n=1 Tax=Eschrichtius robustus TaxID=9764 RepID=A0AB34HA73_ESCRO|nr:hypothetical protein J1605_005502 [Eschrichtius robustus]